MATKRRGDYFEQAKTLARKYKSQSRLEKQMETVSLGLVKGLRDKLIRWEEYERSMLDNTLTSALAAVILGAKNDKPTEKMEKAWPVIVGDMLPPLTKFLAETKEYIDNGVLLLGDQTVDFADYDLANALALADNPLLDIDPEEQGEIEASQGRARGQSWPSLLTRVVNYLSRPTFSFFSLGEYMVARDQGYKEMRRVAKNDKRTCKDCRRYDAEGWVPFGESPMPGKGCQCYANCRCFVEYR
jgi:hypothetical protein